MENNKPMLRDPIKYMNKLGGNGGVWTPSIDESMSSLPLNRRSPDLVKESSIISGDSPTFGRATPNNLLRLQLNQAPISPNGFG